MSKTKPATLTTEQIEQLQEADRLRGRAAAMIAEADQIIDELVPVFEAAGIKRFQFNARLAVNRTDDLRRVAELITGERLSVDVEKFITACRVQRVPAADRDLAIKRTVAIAQAKKLLAADVLEHCTLTKQGTPTIKITGNRGKRRRSGKVD